VSEDPTNLAARNGFHYDPLTAGSGLGNVYVNAKWLLEHGASAPAHAKRLDRQ
jgi:hypothetical protein